jgi:hypothetical protein
VAVVTMTVEDAIRQALGGQFSDIRVALRTLLWRARPWPLVVVQAWHGDIHLRRAIGDVPQWRDTVTLLCARSARLSRGDIRATDDMPCVPWCPTCHLVAQHLAPSLLTIPVQRQVERTGTPGGAAPCAPAPGANPDIAPVPGARAANTDARGSGSGVGVGGTERGVS